MTAHQEALSDDVLVLAGAHPELRIVVRGEPIPQGSKTRNQYGAIYDSNAKRLKPWRVAVSTAAEHVLDLDFRDEARPLFRDGVPVLVEATFTLARAKGHYGTGRNAEILKDSAPRWFTKAPDLDKLIRSCFDSLTDCGVWREDKQVVEVLARKGYPGYHPDALDIPGAVIRVRALE